MKSQDLQNLQEAYLEVYNELDEGKVEWDNPKRHLPSGLTPREKNRAKRISTGVENPNIKPSEKQLERYGKLKIAHDTEKGKKVPRNTRHHFSQFDTGPFVSDPELKRREKKNKLKDLKEPKESYDYYDIILSHLLDEGYADTPEAAEVIMVNMSEDWRGSIVEEVLNEGKGSKPDTTKDAEEFAYKIGQRARKNPQNADKYQQGLLRLKGFSPSGSRVLDYGKRGYFNKKKDE